MSTKQQISAFPLHNLDYIKGEPVNLANTKGKNIVVVEMWATWCGPCRTSIPHISKLQKQYGPRGLIVVGITAESRAEAAPFVQKMGSQMDYRVAADPTGQTYEKYSAAVRARGIPNAIILNSDNYIVFSGHPMDPAFEQTLVRQLATLSSASSSEAEIKQPAEDSVVTQVEALIKKAQASIGSSNSSSDVAVEAVETALKDLKSAQLKQVLSNHGFDARDCLEKSELIRKIMTRVVRLDSSSAY